MEKTLKQRLEDVINKLEAKANDDWINAQGQHQVMHHHLIGWAGGSRNAIEILKADFPDILEDKSASASDEPVEPFHYIDSSKIMFRDAYGRFYFWDENYFKAHGPYGTNVEACKQMREYARQLDNETILESLGIDPGENE